MSRDRTTHPLEVLLSVRQGAGSLRGQLERELRGAVRSGRLPAGTALPSTRALASQLGVSRGVVVEAYDQLVAEGYLLARQGSATRVAETAAAAKAAPSAEQAPQRLRYDFRPGVPALDTFPRTAWLASLRKTLTQVPLELGPQGDARLPPDREEQLQRTTGPSFSHRTGP